MLANILLFIVGIVLLYYGAEMLVKNSSWLAKSIGVAPLVIGMTVVAFGTSAPELLVSAVASIQNKSGIALGNVIGSNIANIGLVLGLIILIWPPKSEATAIKREYPFLLVVSLLFFLVSLDGNIGRIDGIVFILLFVIFIYYNIFSVRKKIALKFKEDLKQVEEKVEATVESVVDHRINERKKKRRKAFRNLFLAILGLAMLIAGSKLLVDSAVSIAKLMGVSQMVIAVSLVAVGTSLPELFTSVIASIKKADQINIGMILGSNIFNTLLILGVAALIFPISVPWHEKFVSIPLMFVFTVMIFPVLRKDIRVHRLFGLFLVLGYFVFIFYSFVA